MNWLTIAATYFVVWWLCLFIVLPIGVRTQAEEGETTFGTDSSAPHRPMLGRKALAATVIAAAVVAVAVFAFDYFDVSLESVSHALD